MSDLTAYRVDPVVESGRVVRTYPAVAATPAAARALVYDALQASGRTDLADIACLLTSELVTNAVIHAATDLTIRVTVDADLVRVEVEDGSALMPRAQWPQAATAEQRSDDDGHVTGAGRGLQIVGSLSHWGVSRMAKGKVVWFELPVHSVKARSGEN
jgi:anti-sigma regulatory factor (Ser/Thr protein kinase)